MRTDKSKKELHKVCKWLNRRYKLKNKSIIEIGSYKGDSALIFSKYFGVVFCVDPWDDDLFEDALKNEAAASVEKQFDANIAGKSNIIKIKSIDCFQAESEWSRILQ